MTKTELDIKTKKDYKKKMEIVYHMYDFINKLNKEFQEYYLNKRKEIDDPIVYKEIIDKHINIIINIDKLKKTIEDYKIKDIVKKLKENNDIEAEQKMIKIEDLLLTNHTLPSHIKNHKYYLKEIDSFDELKEEKEKTNFNIKIRNLLNVRILSYQTNNEIDKKYVDSEYKKIENSAFNKQGYRVSISLLYLREHLKRVCDYDNYEKEQSIRKFHLPTKEILFDKMIPEFQRDNDKWNLNMKEKFIENLIKGFDTELKFFRVGKNILTDVQILDGLQRLTAINDFIIGNLYVFKNEDNPKGINFIDILTNPKLESILNKIKSNSKITYVEYEFKTIEEVVEFYIEMNENITHSSEDIERAKKFLLTKNQMKKGSLTI